MKSDNLRPISNDEIAGTCERLAADESVPPAAAWVLKMAATLIRRLDATNVHLAQANERLEHVAETYRAAAYGPQKGGAA